MTLEHVLSLRMEDYDYPLPDERIAKYPLEDRSSSRLLVYRKGEITPRHFVDLPALLPEGSLLVRNNSRVIRARLHFRRPTGALVEVFCLDPYSPTSYELALGSRDTSSWHCMVGNARRWRTGETLTRTLELEGGRRLEFRAERGEGDLVHFSWSDDAYTFGELLELLGVLPIPPYLNRPTEASDLSTYQTVYAQAEGSVAAPTAGLHFTPRIFEELGQRGIETLDLTLHVGAGTFRPVKSQTIGEHEMHREIVEVSRSAIACLMAHIGHIVAVGTTSVRTIESLYHLGRDLLSRPEQSPQELCVSQWMPYDGAPMPEARESLEALLSFMDRHGLSRLTFPTSILITPGYTFALVRGLITNFHQPHSTLLLLISAFVGEDWRRIYDYALDQEFRFLSYGDSSLLLP